MFSFLCDPFEPNFRAADLTGGREITEDFLWATSHIRTVAVHDYGRTGCEGATRAVEEFARKTKRSVHVVDTLAVIERHSHETQWIDEPVAAQ